MARPVSLVVRTSVIMNSLTSLEKEHSGEFGSVITARNRLTG